MTRPPVPRQIDVFIASPGDLVAERSAFRDVCKELSKGFGGDGHTFAINATSDPNFVRLGALNNFVSGSGTGLQLFNVTVSAIPEPSSAALVGIGLAGVMFMRRRCRGV